MRTRLGLLVLSLAVIASLLVGACAAPQSQAPGEPFKVGITGDMTGFAAVTYSPGLEALRVYFSKINDAGGINGHQIEFYIEDNRSEPPRALSNAKLFVEKGVNLIMVHAISATYSGVLAECQRADIPMIILGSATPDVNDPTKNRLLFTTMYESFSLAVQADAFMDMVEREKFGKAKMGILGYDIPATRAGDEVFAAALNELGAETLSIYVPLGPIDMPTVALQFKEAGCNWLCGRTAGGVSFALYEAAKKVGSDAKLWTAFYEPIEKVIELAIAGGEKMHYGALWHVFQQADEFPELNEVMADLEKYGVSADKRNSMAAFSYFGGTAVEEIVRRVDWPVTTEGMLEVMNDMEFDCAPFWGKKVWTEDDHTGLVWAQELIIDEQGNITPASDWWARDYTGKSYHIGKKLK